MEEFLQQERHSKIMGWKKMPARAFFDGVILQKGNTEIWQIHDGWQVADVVEGFYGGRYFDNHRPEKTLAEAIDKNS